TLGEESVAPLAHRLRVDLEPLSGLLDRPMLIDDARHHPSTPLRGQRRVRVLPRSVGHELLLVGLEVVEDPQTPKEGSPQPRTPNTTPPGTTSPVITASRSTKLGGCPTARCSSSTR